MGGCGGAMRPTVSRVLKAAQYSTLVQTERAAQAIEQSIGADRITFNQSVISNHSSIEKGFGGWSPPHAVAFAESTPEVQAILAHCNENKVPVVCYGAGTSVEGHLECPAGGIMLDLSRMDQVVELNEEDMDCRVQAGVTREALNQQLRHSGLWFTVDPGGNASLGGMVATNASGTTTLKYGSMKDNVLNLEVVTAQGEVVRTGARARKSSAGDDLTRLMIGSEGTLGVVTEIQARLHPQPEAQAAAVVQFETLSDAVEAVVAVTYVTTPARVELLDQSTMECLNGWRGQEFAESPTVFFDFHGGCAAVEEQVAQAKEMIESYGGHGFESGTLQEERNKLWFARHNAFWAVKDKYPGLDVVATDVAAPMSRLAETIEQSQQDAKELGVVAAPMFGHVGDGNFHFLVMFDSQDAKAVEHVHTLEDRLIRRAISYGGTATGEHGSGAGKSQYLPIEFGEPACAMMGAIKRALDPNNILNPHKMSKAWGDVVPPH